MDVLAEMLSTLEPGDKEGLNQEAIVDLVDQCHSYKKRVVHLLNNTSDEELLCQGLTLNDDLEKLLSKYDAIALGITVPPEKNKPLAALLDIGDGSDASQASNLEHGSVPDNIENQPPLQQLLLSAPPGALSTPAASLNSKMDLLSFEDLQPPTGNDTLALVPVGTPTSQSSQTQQMQDHDALALSDPFPQDCLSSPNSHMMLPTSQRSSQSETKAQSQPEGQQIMWSLGSNGSIPDLGEPQHLQLVQNVPSTGASDSTTATGAHKHLQRQMVPAFYSNSSLSTMEAAHQHQQMQTALYSNGSILNAASGLHDRTAYLPGMHLNQISPDFNGQVTSKLNNPQQTLIYGSSSTGAFPPAPWEIQPMQTFQAFEFGHGQQTQMQFPEHMPYRLTTPQAQRAEGFTLQDDIYMNSYQTSAAYSHPKKLVKPQDALFGDLVSIAKVKSKPTSSEK